MKIRAKNREQTVDMTLPVTDMDMQYYMKRIGIEDVMPVCCISEVRDEPPYFGFLKGQTVNMDELNFFARRLDGMTEYEKRVVGVYSSETGIREMKQLINLTYSLQGLSLLTDLTDGNRVGLRLYLDRHIAISEEEKSRIDFNAYAQRIFSEGKCKFLPHGILVDQGFHMEEVYNGRTFPEYIDRPDETVAVLSLGNEAGDKEYLYLPRPSRRFWHTVREIMKESSISQQRISPRPLPAQSILQLSIVRELPGYLQGFPLQEAAHIMYWTIFLKQKLRTIRMIVSMLVRWSLSLMEGSTRLGEA